MLFYPETSYMDQQNLQWSILFLCVWTLIPQFIHETVSKWQ